MRLRVGEVEGAAEDVAEFVVEGHAYAAEAGAAEPGAVECFLPRGLGFWVRDDLWEG